MDYMERGKFRGRVEGAFQLTSGYATLNSSAKDGLKITKNDVPLNGTLVVCRIGYSEKIDLRDALVFGEKVHTPALDYIDTHFQTDENGVAIFDLGNESEGFGSRSAGDPIRRKLRNLIQWSESGKVIVDLKGVALMSSSYADEVFGKLFADLGPIQFTSHVSIRNVDPLVQALIDKAIVQRIRQ